MDAGSTLKFTLPNLVTTTNRENSSTAFDSYQTSNYNHNGEQFISLQPMQDCSESSDEIAPFINNMKAFPSNTSNKMKAVEKIINMDPLGADLKLSLYIAAAESSPDGTWLRPYPPGFHPHKNFDEELLSILNEQIPTVALLQNLDTAQLMHMSKEAYDVLHWNLVFLKEPRFQLILPESFPSVLSKVKNTGEVIPPSMIFKLMYGGASHLEMKWQALMTKGIPTEFAYFSCDVHKFHTLLHYGLTGLPITSTPGVTLSKNLDWVLQTSPVGWTWGKSCIGSQISVVAVVEYINDSSVICTHNEYYGEECDSNQNFYLTNPDLGRLRFLLVYVKRPGKDFQIPKFCAISKNISRTMWNLFFGSVVLMTLSLCKSHLGVQCYTQLLGLANLAKNWIAHPRTL